MKARRLIHETRGAIRSWWWRASGYAEHLERENADLREAADFRFKQYVAARDVAHTLRYPPIDHGGALLLAAEAITLEQPTCENAEREWDTGAWNCDRERAGEVCWCQVASELRDLEKHLREAAPFNAAAVATGAA